MNLSISNSCCFICEPGQALIFPCELTTLCQGMSSGQAAMVPPTQRVVKALLVCCHKSWWMYLGGKLILSCDFTHRDLTDNLTGVFLEFQQGQSIHISPLAR